MMTRPKPVYIVTALARLLDVPPRVLRDQLRFAKCPLWGTRKKRIWTSDLRQYAPHIYEALLDALEEQERLIQTASHGHDAMRSK